MKQFRSKRDIPLKYYIFQSVAALIIIFVALVTLGYVADIAILGTIGATSLGASAFIAFGAPHSHTANPRRMLGSYLLACIIGIACFDLLHFLLQQPLDLLTPYLSEFVAALAVMLTMLLMLLFGLEHPPAMGIALGLVFEQWDYWTVNIILIAILLIIVSKVLLKSYMKDLF